MAATATSHEDAKVVLIDTQYVQTDPLSFKSVVQRLTGKDCCVAWIKENSVSGIKTETQVAGKVATERSYGTVGGFGYGDASGLGVSMLTKGLSFKDLDIMISKAPSMDELKWLWVD